MADYALNDRGSLQVVTENFYDAEILRVLGSMEDGRPQAYDGPAHLVPEPDNPHDPQCISVRIDGQRVGHLARPDAQRYWPAITRVVASGYDAAVTAHLSAAQVPADGSAELEADLRLDLAAPELLFPINSAPQRATVLPQGSAIKVLEEQEHAEYLHSILPRTGEGRLMLTLEVNQIRTPQGEHADIVEVLHQRQLVGRLSTQLSEQFIPVIRHAFDHDLLTAAWGTIRGTAYEVSLTVQAARPDTIPEQWFQDLPREFLPLEPEAESYRIPDAYVPAEAELSRPARRWRLSGASTGSARAAAEHTGSSGAGSTAVGAASPDDDAQAVGSPRPARTPRAARAPRPARAPQPVRAQRPARTASSDGAVSGAGAVAAPSTDRSFPVLLGITAVLVIVGLLFLGREPLVTALCLIAAAAAGAMAFYLRSVMLPSAQDGAESGVVVAEAERPDAAATRES